MKSAQPEVCVKMKNLENGTEFIWPKEKFLNRLYLMKEMYNNYEDEDDWDLPEEKDPFQARNYRKLKFIYSEKATKFCEIFTLLLSYVVPVKSKVKISQNFVAFSEYINFKIG